MNLRNVYFILAATAATCPARDVMSVLKLVMSESVAWVPVVAALRGEVMTHAVV